jgi:hypothetical protein
MSNTEHLSQKLVVPIPNSVSQGAIKLIHSWFTNKMLKINRTQVRKQVMCERGGEYENRTRTNQYNVLMPASISI